MHTLAARDALYYSSNWSFPLIVDEQIYEQLYIRYTYIYFIYNDYRYLIEKEFVDCDLSAYTSAC